ncbi:MMPL family transporter [Candidatus Woesearchaeota archaeon]|nr:MMPL family transporter [Candidatus Woesearchaeota archaeon]
MFKKILEKIARFQVKNPYITVLIILTITIILFSGMQNVRTVASMEKMMPPQVEEIKAFNTLRDNYLGQDMVAIVIKVDRESSATEGVIDVRDKRVTEYVQSLKKLIEESPDIRQAYASSDIIEYAMQQQGIDMTIRELPDNYYAQILSNQQVKDQLSNFINDDYSVTMILATTDIAADDSRMNLLATKVLHDIDSMGKPPGVEIKVTGTPIIQQKLGELIAQDRSNTQWISTGLVFLITMILFGTFTSALVPIIIVTISVNWLYGIMGYTNLPISTLAGGVAAMVIGIGIDYSIHMMNKFKNERKKGNSIEESAVKAVTETGTALTGAAVATILAFLAFLLGAMPEMNRFGLLMAIGVSSAFILSIFGLPSLLIIEEKIIHAIRKKLHFGIEGEYQLCDVNEIHPETHEEISSDKVKNEELRTMLKGKKIIKKKKELK